MAKCINECGKDYPDEWGKECCCSNECLEEYEKKTIKPLKFSREQFWDLWQKDDKIPRICENCIFLWSDGSGDDYCSNVFPICDRFEGLENFIGIDYKGDSFPFKKPKRCFQLSFWFSNFANLITGVDFNDEIVRKAFFQNPSFRDKEKEYFDVVLQRLIDAEIERAERERLEKKEQTRGE